MCQGVHTEYRLVKTITVSPEIRITITQCDSCFSYIVDVVTDGGRLMLREPETLTVGLALLDAWHHIKD